MTQAKRSRRWSEPSPRKSEDGTKTDAALPLKSSYQPVKVKQISAMPASQENAQPVRNGGSVAPAPPKLLEGFIDREIDYIPVSASCERSGEINATAATIHQLYKPIQARRKAIRDSLVKFKTCLGLSKETAMSACFGRLKSVVGDIAELELLCSGEEPLKLKFIRGAWSSTDSSGRDAVGHFNEVLNHCQKYKGDRELKLADIRFKLEDLHLMPLTREGQVLYDALSHIPDYFEELSKDIDHLHMSIMQHQEYLY